MTAATVMTRAMLFEIVLWMRTTAIDVSNQAASRLESEKDRNATAAELKQSRALAEQMTGRRSPRVNVDPEAFRIYCDMQVRIGRKLEAEAKRLTEWADCLVTLSSKCDSEEAKSGKKRHAG